VRCKKIKWRVVVIVEPRYISRGSYVFLCTRATIWKNRKANCTLRFGKVFYLSGTARQKSSNPTSEFAT